MFGIDDLNNFIKNSNPDNAQALCSTCGQAHTGECPLIQCRMCGEIHERNPEYSYIYCTQNDRFKKWYKGHKNWIEQNTKQIWEQSDKEDGE